MRLWSLIAILVIFMANQTKSRAAVEPKLIYEEDSTLLTTTVEVVVLTGAADDPSGKTGVTNMLGELMLRGTKKKSRTKFQSELERLGGSLSVHISSDAVYFVGRVIRENTTAFLKLLDESLTEPAFSKKEFESLKVEILGDIAYRKNQNGRLAGLTLRKTVFAGTPLERSFDGGAKTVAAIKLDDLIKTYNNQFHQGNFIFAAASPMKEAELKKVFTATWLKFPDGAKLTRRMVTPQIPKAPVFIVINKPDTSTGSMYVGQAGIVAQDPLRYALMLGNYTFGGEPLISRLFSVIRSELGWTYAISSTYNVMGTLTNQPGLYVISSTPSVEFTSKALLKILDMWKQYLKEGLKPDELKLAQDSLINSYPFNFDSAEKRLGQRLHSYMYNVPILSPDEFAKTVSSITNDKLRSALAERQTGDGWVITLVADAKTIEKQLAAEQKNIPVDKQLKISKVISPDDVIE
jgi:zinc protease